MNGPLYIFFYQYISVSKNKFRKIIKILFFFGKIFAKFRAHSENSS